MKNPIMYVVLNGELKMSPGKAAAQAVHSAMLLNGNSKSDFLSDYRRTVIVLEAKNAMQLQNLAIYLDGADIDSDYYIDEGVNEVDAYSITALAAFVGDNEELRQVFGKGARLTRYVNSGICHRLKFSNVRTDLILDKRKKKD